MKRRLLLAGIAVAVLAWLLPGVLRQPLERDLQGQIAVITGGSRGAGRGFAHGLVEAGATVYITGRTRASLESACEAAPGPGACIPRVVDSGNDSSLEEFFASLAAETQGRLDILVNNAYSAIPFVAQEQLLGKPFWEAPMSLFDEVFRVGVRSHYKATLLALPLMLKHGRGLIVNTNSPGCLLYAINVAYGMGKCSIDKMTADMAMELGTEGGNITMVSWWPGVPMQSEEILAGSLDGGTWRRGVAPGLQFVPSFSKLAETALATTPLFEGRSLASLARDPARSSFNGLVVVSAQLGALYGVRDERGLCPPSFLSVKYQLVLWIPPLLALSRIPSGSAGSARSADISSDGNTVASPAQAVFFNDLPNIHIPIWLLKVISGPPLTFRWPLP